MITDLSVQTIRYYISNLAVCFFPPKKKIDNDNEISNRIYVR